MTGKTFCWTAAVLLLAGCGGGEPATINAAGPAADVAAATEAAPAAAPVPSPSASPTPNTAADEAAIRALIDKGYAGYRTNSEQDQFVTTADFDAAQEHALGKDGVSDADYYCQCQDYDSAKFTHSITALKVDGDRATATVAVRVFGTDAPNKVTFVLARTAKGWAVDDVDGIKAEMKKAPAGSWDVGSGA